MASISCPECGAKIKTLAEICPSCKKRLPLIVKEILLERSEDFKEDNLCQKKRSYFIRHWKGELSLAVSYWISRRLS